MSASWALLWKKGIRAPPSGLLMIWRFCLVIFFTFSSFNRDLSLKESLIKGQVFWFYQLPIPQCQERLFLSVVSHLRKSTQIGNLLKSHLSNKECKWENFQALFLWSLYIIKILGVGDHLKHYVIIKLGRQTSNRHGPDSFGKLSHQKLSASVPGILLSDH